VLEEAERVAKLDLGAREDLTQIPIVAIDPADARDHDDAVWAAPDDDPANAGGWKAIVAIADVSFYVRPGSALDKEARKRGNSVYFRTGWCRCSRRRFRPMSARSWRGKTVRRSCATSRFRRTGS
jgi:exoribonuclease R